MFVSFGIGLFCLAFVVANQSLVMYLCEGRMVMKGLLGEIGDVLKDQGRGFTQHIMRMIASVKAETVSEPPCHVGCHARDNLRDRRFKELFLL